jgi:hypothetical protein
MSRALMDCSNPGRLCINYTRLVHSLYIPNNARQQPPLSEQEGRRVA